MSGFFNEKIIDLDIINTDLSNESTINLFELPNLSSGGGVTTYELETDPINDVTMTSAGLTWTVYEGGIPTLVYSGTLPSPASAARSTLAAALTATTNGTWVVDGQKFKTTDSTTQYTSGNKVTTLLTFFFNIATTSINTGSPVEVVGDEQEYNSLSEELNFGSYRLDYVNVYADNIEQANRYFSKTIRNSNGNKRVNIENPTISPVQSQFAVEEVNIDYVVTPTNKLEYTLGAGESVRLIFKYSQSGGRKFKDGAPFNKKVLNKEINKFYGRRVISEKVSLNKSFEPPIMSISGVVQQKSPLEITKEILEKEKILQLGVENLSEDSIKKKVANKIASSGGSTTYDPYNYIEGNK